MRDFDAVISLLPHVRESLPREVTRKDIEWLLTLHDKAVAAVETYHNSRSNDETSPYNSEKTDAELNMAGWRTRLIKRAVHPPAEEPTSETKSTSDIGGPLLDPSWWDGLLPSTMGQEAELTGGMIFGTGSSDWVSTASPKPETLSEQYFVASADSRSSFRRTQWICYTRCGTRCGPGHSEWAGQRQCPRFRL